MNRPSQKDRIKKSGKQKQKKVKGIPIRYGDPDPELVFKIPKGVEDDKKIRPKDVFEGYSESTLGKNKRTRKKKR